MKRNSCSEKQCIGNHNLVKETWMETPAVIEKEIFTVNTCLQEFESHCQSSQIM